MLPTRLVKFLTISVAACLLIPIFASNAKAQASGLTVGHWQLSEIKTSGSYAMTPDSTGVNTGVLIGVPEQPILVDSKFGKAMQFDGKNSIYVPIKFVIGFPPTPQPVFMAVSPNLDIQKHVSINAWINISQIKDALYNNIVVKCTHPDQACAWQNTTRINGISIRGTYLPDEGSQVVGAISGYVYTDSDGFSEIVTTQEVPLNQWINVEFTRTATGMHLFINGHEQSVNVIHGVQNPQGRILNGTEYYFGHDSLVTIRDVQITDLDPPITEASFDIGPNVMLAAIGVTLILAIAWVLRRAIQLLIIRPKL